MTKMRTSAEFISTFKSRDDNGLYFDYALVKYTGNENKIKIICPTHGEFVQSAKVHSKNGQCPECLSSNRRSSTCTFLDKLKTYRTDSGEYYNYSLVVYRSSQQKIKIICPNHGKFEQTPNNHMTKNADCPECGKIKTKNTCLLRYGTENPSQSAIVISKIKNTCLLRYGVINGSQTPHSRIKISNALRKHDSSLLDVQQYYNIVECYTSASWKKYATEINPMGLTRANFEYHLDHKFSKMQGFINNIPPDVIGHWQNLEMLWWKDNIKKGQECSIDIDVLITNIKDSTIHESTRTIKRTDTKRF